jgi:hypothetical protein
MESFRALKVSELAIGSICKILHGFLDLYGQYDCMKLYDKKDQIGLEIYAYSE